MGYMNQCHINTSNFIGLRYCGDIPANSPFLYVYFLSACMHAKNLLLEVLGTSMYIHFNLFCNDERQWKLHRLCRHKFREWKGLVERVVLTYHYNNPPDPDCLYVCLDIPSVEEPQERTVMLSEDIRKQIPGQIMDFISTTCQDYGVKFNAIDYYYSLEVSEAPLSYENASVEEILRFASIGSEIAIGILNRFEKDQDAWRLDKDLARFVYRRLKAELDVENLEADYKWWYQALHFVANPLGFHQDWLVFPHFNRAIERIKYILDRANG